MSAKQAERNVSLGWTEIIKKENCLGTEIINIVSRTRNS